MAELTVDVVSAEARLYTGQATRVTLRSLDGELGLMPGHQPAVLALATAPLDVATAEGETVTFAVHDGFAEFRENVLTVLADRAERPSEIDTARAEAARERAMRHRGEQDYEGDAEAELARAELRLRLAGAASGS